MLEIMPSLASADQMRLGDEIEKVRFIGRLHFDIEDGNFVPNITFGMKTIQGACRRLDNVVCDAHLMVMNPLDYIDELAKNGFAEVAFHWESAPYPMRIIQKIRKNKMKVGIAINPRTPISDIYQYINLADYILLMSSEPDEDGERFQEHSLDKIKEIRKRSDTKIIVDGGVNKENIGQIKMAGANAVVLGRAIFRAKDIPEMINILERRCSI